MFSNLNNTDGGIKMKKILTLALMVLLSLSIIGCATAQEKSGEEIEKEIETQIDDKDTVNALVGNFGRKLHMVSLLAPEDILKESLEENYGDFVSPALLEEWLKDPVNAPGRLTSSPWPDRIEILNTEKISDGIYEVKGVIIEIANEKEIVAKRPITIKIEKIDGKWLINDTKIGEYEETSPVIYENTQYDFGFALPESWKGYTTISEKWEGLSLKDTNEGDVVETGPIILIRHPKWTSEEPRQDIPIMIFTIDQWNSLQKGEFHIGAAPIGPTELGRNDNYVFALPARYNFEFLPGYEEVEDIFKNNPLRAKEDILGC